MYHLSKGRLDLDPLIRLARPSTLALAFLMVADVDPRVVKSKSVKGIIRDNGLKRRRFADIGYPVLKEHLSCGSMSTGRNHIAKCISRTVFLRGRLLMSL